MDETKLAERTGIPEFPLLLLGAACLVLGYWFLVTAIPRGQRVRAIVPTLVGALAVGGPLWVLWPGPPGSSVSKPVARVLPYDRDSASLIGSLRDKLEIKGDIMSTGIRWDAEC